MFFFRLRVDRVFFSKRSRVKQRTEHIFQRYYTYYIAKLARGKPSDTSIREPGNEPKRREKRDERTQIAEHIFEYLLHLIAKFIEQINSFARFPKNSRKQNLCCPLHARLKITFEIRIEFYIYDRESK